MKYYVEEHIENFDAWFGGRDTLDTIRTYGKLDDLEDYLQEVFLDTMPSDIEINDFLWFERQTILNALDIDTRTIQEKFSDTCDDPEIETEIRNIIGKLKYNSNGIEGILNIAKEFDLEYTENLKYHYVFLYKCYDNLVEFSMDIHVSKDVFEITSFELDQEEFEINDILSEV